MKSIQTFDPALKDARDQVDTFVDVEPVNLMKTFCADHFEEINGEGSADMGIEGVTFAPGVCAKCGVEAIVFKMEV